MKRIFIPSLRLHLILVAVIIALMTVACGGGGAPAAETKPTIRFADNQYESLWINDAIAEFIIENGYGYPVETISLSSIAAQAALARGDADVWLEMWKEYFVEWYEKETAAGNVIDLTDEVMFEGPAFWMIPKWVAEQYNIKTLEDMKRPEVVKLFQDPENPTKGLFVNCNLGSSCAGINPAKLRTYGLDKYYNPTSAGSQGAIDATFVGAMKKHQPVFGYYWAPTTIAGAYEWYRLPEPPYTEECWKEVMKGRDDQTYIPKQACAYPTSLVTIAIHKDFVKKAPDVVEMLKKMAVGQDPLSRTAAWAAENDIQGKWEKAAVYYLKTYEELWKTWVTPEAYNKIKEALAKAN